ncbi:MAG: ECF RNA polymerase sigma factor SigW [Alphaproteobacteria bacterium ADurb.BinA280]|jgi:RNA polymerase sigma factor (sigma-70 family)|nr:RNA polymerase sigma factor [Xanthomonadales bacterium]OPZ12470.1 MAG: ECF RNA polymerase sigma factor SigW [Alphaproteobacteria bacterium ADurb.BinA280]
MQSEALLRLIDEYLPKAQSGDRAAFGRIVAACQNSITAIALAIVRDVQASEDIAQDAFVNAWRNLASLRNSTSFLPWLRQITRNLSRDHLRRRRTERRYDGDMDGILAVVADPGPDHPERITRQHEEAVVAELIDELPEETREILLIYYREGQSSKQVAALLGMQDAAVRKRLSRARQSLHRELLERIGDFAMASAPTAMFTAVVVGGLTLSGTAGAATLVGGAVASKAVGKGSAALAMTGKSLGKWMGSSLSIGKGASRVLIGAAGGAMFALLAGVASVIFGVRRYWISAIDETEKRALTRYAAVGIGIVIAFSIGMLLAALQQNPWLPTAAFVVMMAAIGILNLIWLPQILARRHAMEQARDPVHARIERRKERIYAVLGLFAGMALGFSAMLIEWIAGSGG